MSMSLPSTTCDPAITVLLGRYPDNPQKEALYLPSRQVRLVGEEVSGNDRAD
jgi:hypothetical protein